MTHGTGLAFLAFVQLASGHGNAASTRPVPVSLKVTPRQGAHGCPSEKELQREVTAILGYSPFRAHAVRRLISVVSVNGTTLHARIELVDTRSHKRLGLRELSSNGPTCEELGRAMAFAIALAIDPLAQPPAARAGLPPPPPGVAAAPATSAPSVAAPRVGSEVVSASSVRAGTAPTAASVALPAVAASSASRLGETVDAAVPGLLAAPEVASSPLDAGALAATPDAVDAGSPQLSPPATSAANEVPTSTPVVPETPTLDKAWRGIVGAGAEWTDGVVPRHAFGALLHGGIEWRFASVELEVQWLPSTSLAYASGSISSTVVAAALVGCGRFMGFGLCGLFEAGPFSSQGTGYAQSQSQTTWAVAVGVRGQWEWVFAHPVGLRLQVDGLVNVVRTRLLVGADVVWQAPSVALALGAGVFVVF